MQPVDEHYKSVQELVLVELRRQIFTGNLKAGQRLIVRELAEILQVSATPIRLALTQLASEGFVRIVGPRRGVEVCSITPDEVEELYLMRIELEKLAVRLGAKFKTPEDMQHVRAVAEEYLEVSSKSRDPREDVRAFDTFRTALFEASHRPRLIKTINDLRLASERYRYVYYSFGGTLTKSPLGNEIRSEINHIVNDFEAGKTDFIEKEIQTGHEQAAHLIMTLISANLELIPVSK